MRILHRESRKRPLNRKEGFYLVGFFAIIIIDAFAAGIVFTFVIAPPRLQTYYIEPAVGFAIPNAVQGKYDIAAFFDIRTISRYGDLFAQGTPIQVLVQAFINNPSFNVTGNRIYFSFENTDLWKSGCAVSLGPPMQIQLRPQPGSNGFLWYGYADICSLYDGSFSPIFTIVNGTGSFTYVQPALAENFALTITPPSQIQAENVNNVSDLLAGVLIFFAVIESLPFLREIYSIAFPERIEYKQSQN